MKKVICFLCVAAIATFVQCRKVNTTNNPPQPTTPTTVPLDSVIHITGVSASYLDADSASVSLISVRLSPISTPRVNFVVFTTNLGTFPNGHQQDTAMVDVNGVAVLPLLSNTAGPAMVTAQAEGITVDTTINFLQALPDEFYCTANPYVGGDSINFNLGCQLYRDPGRGRVTDPIKLTFSFTPATGNYGAPALILAPFANSVKGIATDSIKNPYKNTGTYIITASTAGGKGGNLTQSVTISIQ